MTLVADNHSTDLDAIRGRAGEILALDGWSRERLLDLQRERLRALLAHASAHSPYYRDVLGSHAEDADLTDLPTLSKPQLIDELDRIVTDPRLHIDDLRRAADESRPGEAFLDSYRVFATSGATGVPGLFVYTHDEFAHWIAAARLARVGITAETRLVAIGATR